MGDSKDFEIATAVGISTASYIFNKAKEKSFSPGDYNYGEGVKLIALHDLQAICQIKEVTEPEERKEATQEEFLKEGE